MRVPRYVLRACAAIVVAVAMTPCALAQFSGNIEGVVKDSSGAVVPHAVVQIENNATSVTNKTSTDSSGDFRFLSLAPGTYSISASAPGFAQTRVSVALHTSESLNVPVRLEIKKATQTVQVESQGPLLNTSETNSESTMETQALTSLPLPGRSMIGLVTMAPGVTGLGQVASGSPGSAADNFSTESQVDASANGRGSVNNLYIVDGLDVTSIIRPGVLNLTPNPDSTQEETTEVNNFSVAYARGASLIMRITTRSGSDRFHGFASDYFTDQHLWAGTEFVHSYAPFHSNNMSAGLGGPISRRHHMFFFGSIEPLRSSTATGNGTYSFEDHAFTAWAKQNYPDTIGTMILSKYPASNASNTAVSAKPGLMEDEPVFRIVR
ncbi:MAG: carboxypeptidase regulatory-like domain-containing protein [Nitrososphaerota archaeon]|nr:carboxypeptidase regulatory-like domain-containing protein [Nitrososphaerota archaeon]